MIKKLLSVVLFLCISVPLAFAQSGSVTGKVTDAKTGKPLPGVNVVIKELQKGTATNGEGMYNISDVPAGSYTLMASFIGYKNYQTQITVGQSEVTQNIKLQSSVVGLQDVVVTALGFQASKDESGVSTTRVQGETVSQSGESTVLKGLSAKIPGVNITGSSGDPGAGARIVIRGANSLQTDNQPLFIIDGVPVFNSTIGSGVDGVVQQSRMNDLNPDDIASVDVLKGPSAAAIWGSRAANGAIVITTKSGSKSNDVKISLQSELTVDQVNKNVNLQNKYGQGIGGSYVWGYPLSWGDPIAERAGGEDVRARPGYEYSEITQKNSRQTYDHASEVFQDAYSWKNSLSVSGGNDQTTYYLSVANSRNNGVVLANSNFNRNSFRLNVDHNFTEKLSSKVNANYIQSNSDRIQMGSNISGLLLGTYRTPPDFNNQPYLVNYVAPNGNVYEDEQRSYRDPAGDPGSGPGYDNPLWTIYKNRNHSDVKRIMGSAELKYNMYDWLNFVERVGIDTYTDRRYQLLPPGNATVPSGSLTENEINQYQFNNDFIIRAFKDFSEDYSGNVLVGYNLNHRATDELGATSTNFILDNAPKDVGNAVDRFPFQTKTVERTSALYAQAEFNAFDQLYMKVSGRSESASTYGENSDKTYFYPSANIAWQFSDLDAFQDQNILSFGKVRASYGKAGTQPSPYSTRTNYLRASYANGWGPEISATYYGGGAMRSNQEGNSSLKPEITTEFETGVDLRFVNDRIGLSFTRYWKKTTDALLSIDVPPSSGFSSRLANAAEIENKGYEVSLDLSWIRSRDFQWNTHVIWSKNDNKVTSLAGVNNVFLNGFTDGSSRAVEGYSVGVLYGSKWERDDSGNLILDENGFPQIAPAADVLGDPTPDWTSGIRNTFSYKGFTLTALLDIKQGGDVWNGTKGALYYFGVHGDQTWSTTADQDLVNYLGDTIPSGTTFRGYVKDFGDGPVAIDETYFWAGPGSGFTGPTEQFIEDGSYVRLREVGLTYTLQTKAFRDFTGLSSIRFGITGRNLKLWTDYSGVDPETNLTGPSNGQGLDYFNNPNTRTWLFSLRVNY